ncbi:hypothetical protein MBLNU457_3406t1 [Dothideomycetes sp. NU457]
MDHPDLPAGLRLPRKTKSSRSSEGGRDMHVTASINSTGSEKKRSKSPLSFGQRVSHDQNIAIRPAVAPLDPGFLDRKQALESSIPLQPQKDAIPRRRFTFLSRKSKPAPIKISHNQDLAIPQQAQRQTVTRMDSRLMHGKPSPTNLAPAVSAQDCASAKSLSPPSSPGFIRRLLERIETAPRPKIPSPTFSFQDPHELVEADLAESQDLALFAAATAGLSPEQPFAAGQMTQYVPFSQPRHRSPTSKSYASDVSLSPSPSTNHSLSSLSQGAGSPSIAASSSDYRSATPYGQSRSKPCPPRTCPDTGSRDTYGLSQSSPLSGWDTSMCRWNNASREGGPRRSSASRSFDLRRPEPVMQNIPPMPISSHLMHPPSSSLLQTSNPLQIRTRLPTTPVQPNSSDASVMSPISPPDTAFRWQDDNVSALSVDTLTYSRNTRISAISTLSSISTLDGGVSPIGPENDCELPDYKTSQEETARMQQLENVKRAQELQMRWILSRGN